jgi:hypothetical protein
MNASGLACMICAISSRARLARLRSDQDEENGHLAECPHLTEYAFRTELDEAAAGYTSRSRCRSAVRARARAVGQNARVDGRGAGAENAPGRLALGFLREMILRTSRGRGVQGGGPSLRQEGRRGAVRAVVPEHRVLPAKGTRELVRSDCRASHGGSRMK